MMVLVMGQGRKDDGDIFIVFLMLASLHWGVSGTDNLGGRVEFSVRVFSCPGSGQDLNKTSSSCNSRQCLPMGGNTGCLRRC